MNSANTTPRQTSSENGSESEAGAKTSELQSLKEKRVHTEVYEHDVEHTAISCECVLKLLGDVTKARYAPRGFEEDVKDGDVIASTTLTASVRLPFAMAVDQRGEQHTAFTAHANTAFLSPSVEKCVVYAMPPPEWSPETGDSTVGTVVWKLEQSLFGLRRRSGGNTWRAP